MSTADTNVLTRLATDDRLARLDHHVPALSMFDLLARKRDEVTHSRVIGVLFDPARHRQAIPALRTFLVAVRRACCEESPGFCETFDSVVASRWLRIRVRRELYRIDVVVEIVSEVGSLVIGIENKIDAGEQATQVARYQDALERTFPSCTSVLAFLSPDGRAATTANANSRVPSVSIGYAAIVDSIDAAMRATSIQHRDHFVLGEIAQHLREEIMGDRQSEAQIREQVRQLWRAHPRALGLAIEFRPRLGDILTAYREGLRLQFGEAADVYTYPNRGEIREIKVRLKPWVDAGFPVTFMLHADEGEAPRLRVFLRSDEYDRDPARFRAWAQRVNARMPGFVDERFPRMLNWAYWRRVLAEDENPDSAQLESPYFDSDTVNEAVARVVSMANLLGE